jgi:hypothetical protein
VLAENKDAVTAMGWQPHSLDEGYNAGDNVVTITACTEMTPGGPQSSLAAALAPVPALARYRIPCAGRHGGASCRRRWSLGSGRMWQTRRKRGLIATVCRFGLGAHGLAGHS